MSRKSASGTSSGSTEATDEAGRQQGALGQASRFVEEAYETGRRYVHDAQQRLPARRAASRRFGAPSLSRWRHIR